MNSNVVELHPNMPHYLGEFGETLSLRGGYMQLETIQAKNGFDRLTAAKGDKYIQPPVSIMAMVATLGTPTISEEGTHFRLTDYDIRFRTPYILHPDEVLANTLAAMERMHYLSQKDAEPVVLPERARIPGRPDVIVRKLIQLEPAAYKQVPRLAKIYDIRLDEVKAARKRGKNWFGNSENREMPA